MHRTRAPVRGPACSLFRLLVSLLVMLQVAYVASLYASAKQVDEARPDRTAIRSNVVILFKI